MPAHIRNYGAYHGKIGLERSSLLYDLLFTDMQLHWLFLYDTLLVPCVYVKILSDSVGDKFNVPDV